jgi:hypothetical protein
MDTSGSGSEFLWSICKRRGLDHGRTKAGIGTVASQVADINFAISKLSNSHELPTWRDHGSDGGQHDSRVTSLPNEHFCPHTRVPKIST